MLYFIFNIFFLFCKANVVNPSETGNVHIIDQSQMNIQNEYDYISNCISSMLENLLRITANIKEMDDNISKRNIKNVVNLFCSYSDTIENVYRVLTEVTVERNCGSCFTYGICFCTDSKFFSNFQIAEGGFNRLQNFLAVLFKGLNCESLRKISETRKESLYLRCKSFIDDYLSFLFYLKTYTEHVQKIVEEDLIYSVETEFKIFLQQKFCCLINGFIKSIQRTVLFLKEKEIIMNGLDFSINVSQLILVDSLSNPSHVKLYQVDRHIKNRIKIYHLLNTLKLERNFGMFCGCALYMFRSKELELMELFNEEQRTGIITLNRFSIDELLSFLPSKSLDILNFLRDSFLNKRIIFFEELKSKIFNSDIDDKTLSNFILDRKESSFNKLERSHISKLLQFTFKGMYWVQEVVYSAEIANFNIFLGSAFMRVNLLVLQIDGSNRLNELQDLSINLLEADNDEKRLEIKKTMNYCVVSGIEACEKYKYLIDLLNRGWFKGKEIDISTETNTRQIIEKEIIDFITISDGLNV